MFQNPNSLPEYVNVTSVVDSIVGGGADLSKLDADSILSLAAKSMASHLAAEKQAQRLLKYTRMNAGMRKDLQIATETQAAERNMLRKLLYRR